MSNPLTGVQLGDSPSGLWVLDGTGTSALNQGSAGTAFNGTAGSNVTLNQPGLFTGVGCAFFTNDFNNPNPSVQPYTTASNLTGVVSTPRDSADVHGLEPGSAVTLEVLVKWDVDNGSDNNLCIAQYGSPLDMSYWLGLDSTWKINGGVSAGIGVVNSGFTVDGNWHLVALRYTGSALSIWIDGTKAAEVACSGTLAYGSNTGAPGLLIGGGWGPSANGTFQGWLNNLAVYPTALSDARLLAHAQAVGFGSATVTRSASAGARLFNPNYRAFARHLVSGENVPVGMTQLLADLLPQRSDARVYGLPNQLTSLTAVTASTYAASADGSHYQRFINAFAIELEILGKELDENLTGGFLAMPGTTHTALEMVYQIPLLSQATIVTDVQANLSAKTLAGIDSRGGALLDPNRSTDVQLLQATRLVDFYRGITLQESFTGGVVFTGNRIGQYADGTTQLEWITVNGQQISAYTIGPDARTITIPNLQSSDTVVVHYTTFDVWYQLEDLSTLYLRAPYYEALVAYTGPAPTPVSLRGRAVCTPVLFMVWNDLDELGLFLGRPRHTAEGNAAYQRRLIDATLYRSGPTTTGLRNALATELGLVQHVLWGPGALAPPQLPAFASTASAITLGAGAVYADSLLIDKLPLAYYSIVPAASGSDTITLSLPPLAPGTTATLSTKLLATGGPVVPTAVPLRFGTSLDPSALAVYDRLTGFSRPRSLFTAPARAWIAGSLQVWKNGRALLAGTDFTELSSTVFQLTTPAQPSDVLYLGYMYAYDGSTLLDIEAQPDIQTDLAPIVQIGVQYSIDPRASGPLYPGWTGIPPGVDPDAVPTSDPWTITFTCTNVGLAASAGATITLQLPPTLTWDGTHLSTSRQDLVHDVRYIDGAQVWVNNLTDPVLQRVLYTATGAAAPLLRKLAAEIAQLSPLEWGDIRWDRSVWRSIDEHASQFGFVPQQLDPPYSTVLTARTILFSGVLTGTAVPVDPALAGQIIVGTSTLGAGPAPFLVGLAPGAAVGASSTVRYPDFRSGIGDATDLQVAYATSAQVAAASAAPVLQRPLPGINAADLIASVPAEGDAMWLVTINPGTYYLNQEEHYLFAAPVYAQTTTPLLYLDGAQPESKVAAFRYDAQAGLVPLRQTAFTDAGGAPTLTYTETLTPVQNEIALTFTNVENFTILAAQDAQSYTPFASAGNIVAFQSCATPLTVSYTLADSFTIVAADGGAWFFMDGVKPQGVLVIYESGNDVMLSPLPIHPYYNPRSAGFLYLSADLYLPTQIDIWVDPQAIPADGQTTFNVKVRVTDDYGAGVADMPVTVLVDYREGALSVTSATDAFGYVTVDLPAQSSVQVARVTATLQLIDATGVPRPALLGQTYIELYAPYAT